MKILIPAKTRSERCPRKNFDLLPFIGDWLTIEGRFEDAIVIYDSDEMRDLAEGLGFCVFSEINPESGDIEAVSDCASVLGLESYIHLPLTQPLRSHNLLSELESVFVDINLAVSVQKIQDRSLFEINEEGKFLLSSRERKGSLCGDMLMVDGAAYICKTDWAIKVKSNEEFWSEPFKYAINHAPFLDIDTKEDMEKFKTLLQLWRRNM